MKILVFNKVLLSGKLLYLIILFIFIGRLSLAQQMVMDKAAVSKNHQNVFLGIMDAMMKKMDHASAGETVGTRLMLQMIPHHEGAIEMAEYEIKYGKEFSMIQLSKSILAEQRNEITLLNKWLSKGLADTVRVVQNFTNNMDKTMVMMMRKMPVKRTLSDIDRSFASIMTDHHRAAIAMAGVALKFTKDQQVAGYCKHLISAEQIEIGQMLLFLKK